MSRKKHRKESHRKSKRETRIDYKLYRYYHTRREAERDLTRMVSKAQEVCEYSTSHLINGLTRQHPSISIEEVSQGSTEADPNTDYQSILISKPATQTRREYVREYTQDSNGELDEAHGGLHIADDPETFDWKQPRPQTPPKPRPEADDYMPLKIKSEKTGKLVNHPSRAFVHKVTGEVIPRRQHMKLRGIIPEIPAAQRGTYTRTIISYGVETHE